MMNERERKKGRKNKRNGQKRRLTSRVAIKPAVIKKKKKKYVKGRKNRAIDSIDRIEEESRSISDVTWRN